MALKDLYYYTSKTVLIDFKDFFRVYIILLILESIQTLEESA